jgi:hypothetical protein
MISQLAGLALLALLIIGIVKAIIFWLSKRK